MRLQGSKRWHEHITSRINDTVKLVGPTISCEGSPKDGKANGEWRTNPHVQSYVLATDQVRSAPPPPETVLPPCSPIAALRHACRLKKACSVIIHSHAGKSCRSSHHSQ